MAQQPNVEITEETQPRMKLEPGPAGRWRSEKPGMPVGPGEISGGGYFGTTGPDPGWGLKILATATLPSDDESLRGVVAGLMLARAAALGRAPVPEDIEVALVLCGYGFDAKSEVIERRDRWLAASAHDGRPGATAVAEVDRSQLILKPMQLIFAIRHSDRA